ncbi:MAG: hypothetical protein ACQGVK_16335 [Myxococcota bacterium]
MHRLLALATAFFLVLGFALEASAIEAAFSGTTILKYKELYEDDTKDKQKFTYDEGVVDSSASINVGIQFEIGFETMFDLKRKSDFKGKVVPNVDPDVDYGRTEDLINSIGGIGTADVFDLNFKYGLQKVNKKFKKNNFELKLKGTYLATDGPRMGEDVGFVIVIKMPKGKRLAF